ncbi:MAG: Hsp70 family protein [Dehalococcoidia bacterium]|nr:Hsp70 family protein [Dehalococcoidia bacterium]
MSYVIGVDVGTTYTAAAIDVNGRTEIFQLGSHAASIPSIVVLRADGEVLTGEAAERRAQSEPARTAREFKRRLGDPVPLLLGGTPYGAEALYAHLLRSVVDQVARQRGEPPAMVVVTHPASYGPYKLDLLRQAVRQAGIERAAMLSEPEAAAIHYAEQERLEPGAVVAVYDFGGGTFDAAVLRKSVDGFELLGEAEGLERLGGIDFDQAVLGLVNTATGGALDRLDPADPTARAAANRLREESREAKEALSSDTESVIPVLLPSLQTEVRLTREEFEEIVRPRLRETTAALERAVRSAGLELEEIDRILLVGGSSRIPLVGALVREATGRPTAVDAHPKHAIALGAAIFGRDQLDNVTATAGRPGPAVLPPSPEVLQEERQPDGAPAPAGTMALTTASANSIPAALRGVFGSPPRWLLLALAGLATVAAIATGLAFLLPGDKSGGDDNRTLLVAGAPAATAGASVAAAAVASASPSLTSTFTATATATPSPTRAPSPTVVATYTPTTRPPTATPATPPPTATPTAPPPTATTGAVSATITGVTVAADHFQVAFTTSGFAPSLAGHHLHFYFNTVPAAAGMDYAGASPFAGYMPSDRPQNAQQICVIVANASHAVIAGSGNCASLPTPAYY